MANPTLLSSIAAVLAMSLFAACSSEDESAGKGSAAPLQCTRMEETNYCFCDRVAGSNVGGGAAESGACSEASVGGPSRCCATKEFLAGGAGGCSCSTAKCVEIGSTCSCRFGPGGQGTSMTSCKAADATKECCMDSTGTSCTCGVPAGSCTGTKVAECTAEALKKECAVGENTLNQSTASCRN